MIRYFLLITAALGLAACETVGGFGQDVERAGDEITETSNEVESEL